MDYTKIIYSKYVNDICIYDKWTWWNVWNYKYIYRHRLPRVGIESDVDQVELSKKETGEKEILPHLKKHQYNGLYNTITVVCTCMNIR